MFARVERKTNFNSIQIRGNIHFLDDEQIIHPVGRVIVVDNINTNQQSYIRLPETGKTITIMCMSPNRKHLAVAEKSARPTISVFCMMTKRRIKVLNNPIEGCTSDYFADICFTCDNKTLVAMAGEPDWLLLFYDWERGVVDNDTKALSKKSKTIIHQICCHPSDKNIIVLVGNEVFRMMNCVENNWQQYGYRRTESVVITKVCWISSIYAIAGTKDGRLLAMEYGDLKGVYRAAGINEIDLKIQEEFETKQITEAIDLTKHDLSGAHEVRALTAYGYGFAYSCSVGSVIVFEKVEKTTYNTKWFKRGTYLAGGHSIGNLDLNLIDVVQEITVSPDEKTLLCTTLRNEIFYGPLQDLNTWKEKPIVPLNKLFNGMHQGPIATVSSAVWKTLFVSVGLVDRTAIIWDYKTREMQFHKEFQDEIYSATMHPTGFYCLIGFTDKLKLLVIFIDNMKTIRHADIKACPLVEFSCGGHLFGAVNGVYIEVYSAITFLQLHVLKGHVGPICALRFLRGDFYMYSCGQEGSVYKWDLYKGTRDMDLFTRENGNFDITASKDGNLVYIVGTDGTLKELCNGEVERSFNLHQWSLYTVALANSNDMMFVAGENGAVLSIAYPISTKIYCEEYIMHTSPVKKVIVTHREITLLSISEDGALCMWEIVHPDQSDVKQDDYKFLTEIMVNLEEWKENKKKLQGMKTRLDEIDEENEYIMRQVVATHEIGLKEIHRNYSTTITDLQNKIKLLEKSHLKEIGECNSVITLNNQKFANDLDELEKVYGAKVAEESNRSQNMLMATKKFMKDYWSKLQLLEKSSQEAMEMLASRKNRIILDKIKEIYEMKSKIYELKAAHTSMKEQIENDCDKEINEIRANYEIKLSKQEEINIKLSSENGLIMKRSNLLEDKIANNLQIIANLQCEKDSLLNVIKDLNREIHNLKLEVAEREWVIQKKDELVVQANRNREDFLKEKYVRDIRIDTLKEKLEPLEIRYKRMVDLYNELEIELDKKNSIIVQLKKIGEGMTKRCLGLSKELKILRERRDDAVHLLKKMKSAIHTCAAVAFEPKLLNESVLKMYQTYVSTETEEDIRREIKTNAEFMYQRKHLEATVKHLKALLNKKPRLVVYPKRQSPKENNYVAKLLSEIDWLKYKLKRMNEKAHLLEKLAGIKHGDQKYLRAKERFENAIKTSHGMKEKHVEQWDFKLAVNLLLRELEIQHKISIEELQNRINTTFGDDIGKRFNRALRNRGLTVLEKHIMDLHSDDDDDEEEEQDQPSVE
ncbi:cilia- and flagella-associated protein 57-like isoform X2 [Cimex lectularius]|uniref:Cilia- and flagella-associated protein 57-like n=1 Tax=Cimex lectularius TaxID=79782 RepID=A0A8I6TJM7_CIMLE|nr:cilia- and flagella-associated protein 57-like isoform X2 [Cimex lectularius]